MRFRLTHLRTRITVWYLAVLAIVLLFYAVGTSALFLWQLQRQLGVHSIQDLETVEGLFFFDSKGQLQLRDDYHNHPESKLIQERLLEVWSDSGAVLYRNDLLGNRSLGGPPFAGEGRGGYSERSARLSDGTPLRLVSRWHVLNGRPILIRLAYSEESIWQRFEELLAAMLFGLPIALCLAGLAGYALATRALSPIKEMAERAEVITLERLNARLPVDNDDELGHLARVFNDMLARLEQSFEQLRRFTSDASHELRTPLAAIRSVGEVGLHKDGTREEYRDIIGSMLEETNRLTRLVDSLLTLSRADAGQIQLQHNSVPVLALMKESAALFEVLMEEREQHLVIDGDERAVIEGDRLFLRQAFVNVLHNAVKYSPRGGTISVQVGSIAEGTITVAVADTGPGISPEHRAKVFDRFYRVDQARTREAGGAGLGLAIAKWVVQIHGGDISLDGADEGGSIFRIQLPARPGSSPTGFS